MQQSVRPPAVAGMFYSEHADSLSHDIQRFLAQAETPTSDSPKAIIAPHAGYVYSGPIAAQAYAQLRAARGRVQRVILLGPCHRVPVRGLALPDAAAFLTPLGRVPVDREAVDSIAALPQVVHSPAAHAMEHSLEVQLPFLQAVLGEFKVVPLVVGWTTAEDVAEVLERLWGGPETLIVISSDLSHYHHYEEAQAMDRETCSAILHLDPQIDHEHACGATPVAGFLLAAKAHGLEAELLDLRNSGDTAGDRSQVVGYAAFAFRERET